MSLQTFVSDGLLSLLGTSDSATVEYFIALATAAKSSTALFTTLTANGLPNSLEAEAFSKSLYSKAPRKVVATGLSLTAKSNAEEARRKSEKERVEMQKMRFSLVLEDEVVHTTATKASKGKGKVKNSLESEEIESNSKKSRIRNDKSKSRKQTEAGDAWESDEEERYAKRRREDERYDRENPIIVPEVEEDPVAKLERERLEDAQERDDFSARMKEREKERTRNKAESKTGDKMDAASVARRALGAGAESLGEVMPDLRIRSRQSYLNKRESQQLDLLRIEIADDERDFKGMKLTKRERSELEGKKEILRLAEERLAIDEGFDGYVIPEGELSLFDSFAFVLI